MATGLAHMLAIPEQLMMWINGDGMNDATENRHRLDVGLVLAMDVSSLQESV